MNIMNELFLAAAMLCQIHAQHVGVEREVQLPAIQIDGKTKWTWYAAYRNGAECTLIYSSDGTWSARFRDSDGTLVYGRSTEAPKFMNR